MSFMFKKKTPNVPRTSNTSIHSYYIDSNDPKAVPLFYHNFDHCLSSTLPKDIENIILLCIGTDRSTGDCLGPYIGHLLHKNKYNNIHILGTLENPVHAKSLEKTLKIIERNYAYPFIIAVDACLGRHESIGNITISPGPLKPGAGVNKSLPEVGDMHITGIVNIGGYMEYSILQSTRLHGVIKMADIIAKGLNEHFHLMSNSYFFNSKTGKRYFDCAKEF